MNENMIHSVIESLILASPEPLPAKKIASMIDEVTPSAVSKAVAELNNRYLEAGISFRIRELAGGYQFFIMPEFTGYVEEMFARTRKLRLTRAALETLAIVAYKQPVTKTDIEQIRGVASDGVVQNLLEKNMLTISGRAESVGKPLLYGTTDEFLKFFGINSLSDLPKMSEIESMVAAADSENQQEISFELDEALEAEPGFNVAVDASDDAADDGVEALEITREIEVASSPEEITQEPIVEEEKSIDDGVIVDMDQTQ